MVNQHKYIIITPARNEEKFIERTIESVVSQTVTPLRWLIVDDGSTDRTAEVVRRYEAEYPFIRLVSRADRGFKKPGYADLEAFNFGLGLLALEAEECDFIAKLDSDLAFEPDYFEAIFERFRHDEKLGIAGGHCYQVRKNKLKLERVPDQHVRGATKIYRRECFKMLEPLPEVPGWDAVDELKARSKGWTTRSFREPKLIHLRPTTGASSGPLRGSVVLGQMSWFLGYHPVFMLARGVKHMANRPYVIGGLAMILGFVTSAITRRRRFADTQFIKDLRDEQVGRLLLRRTGRG